jgi:hypothetical protein
MIHRCIPYCQPDDGEHTELFYGTEDEGERNLRLVLSWRRGELIRFAEEPDAPAKIDMSGLKPFPKAWLVTRRTITHANGEDPIAI